MELEPQDRKALVELEESLWRAATRYDSALMGQVFAEDFFEIGRSGRRYERSEMFVDVDADAVINAIIPLSNYSVGLIAPDVALATYTSEVEYDGGVERGRRSSLWTKSEGRWRLRFHQGTKC